MMRPIRFLPGILLLVAFAPALAADDAPDKAGLSVARDGTIEHGGRITRYVAVNHEQPASLAQEMAPYLGGDVALAAKAGSRNVLRITAPPEKWPIVDRLLEVLDAPEPQVHVEAKIIQIRYNSNLEFGFEGGFDRRKATDGAQPFFGKFTGTFNPQSYLGNLGTGTPYQGGTFEFKTVGERNVAKHGEYSYILRALQERGAAEILSQPSILAIQGRTASIITGQRFPVQSVQVSGTQTTVTTQFEKTGIKLGITPHLVGREYVKLQISAEDSQVTEKIPGPSGSLNPVISERSAKTEMSVRDGETIIIGGLLSSSTIESKSGLPVLGDIPLLSYVFSSTRTQQVKSELVFFITPRIIHRKEHAIILPPGERSRLGE